MDDREPRAAATDDDSKKSGSLHHTEEIGDGATSSGADEPPSQENNAAQHPQETVPAGDGANVGQETTNRRPAHRRLRSSHGLFGHGRETYSHAHFRVYKRRWFGLAQLVLLNIVVSWDVRAPFPLCSLFRIVWKSMCFLCGRSIVFLSS